MKIYIGTFELTAGGVEDPFDFAMDDSWQNQIRQYLRAELAKPKERGNRQSSVSFAITRHHASYLEALKYCVQHAAGISTTGNILFQFEDEGENPAFERFWLRNGHIQRATLVEITGIRTIHRYEFIGGGWTTDESEAQT